MSARPHDGVLRLGVSPARVRACTRRANGRRPATVVERVIGGGRVPARRRTSSNSRRSPRPCGADDRATPSYQRVVRVLAHPIARGLRWAERAERGDNARTWLSIRRSYRSRRMCSGQYEEHVRGHWDGEPVLHASSSVLTSELAMCIGAPRTPACDMPGAKMSASSSIARPSPRTDGPVSVTSAYRDDLHIGAASAEYPVAAEMVRLHPILYVGVSLWRSLDPRLAAQVRARDWRNGHGGIVSK